MGRLRLWVCRGELELRRFDRGMGVYIGMYRYENVVMIDSKSEKDLLLCPCKNRTE